MSFATYASQFLTRTQQGSASAHPSSSSTSAQPLFFSFTTDEGSIHLDDADDPHFHKFSSSEQPEGDEVDDPYLRLDDDDAQLHHAHVGDQYTDANGEDDGEGVGWLAHQRSPSPDYALSPQQPSRTISPNVRPYSRHAPDSNTSSSPPVAPYAQPQSLSLALSESLLPRTGADAHAFHLPAPHLFSRGRRRPQPNAYAAAAFLFVYTLLCVLALLSLVLSGDGSLTERSPPALLHTIPLLAFLTLLSALLSYTHLALLRAFLRPVLLISALAPPFALFLSSVLAFAGSFSSGAGWGLRLFSLIPLALAVLSIRRLPAELQRAARSPAVLSLSTRILFFRTPLLLLLSPLILLAGLILSLPLLTLLVRLPLSHSWYMQVGSAAVAVYTLCVYFVARAVQRSVVAGGVGAWYFSYSIPAPQLEPLASAPAPFGGWNTGYEDLDAQLRIFHATLLRPLGPLIMSALFALVLSSLSLLKVVLYYLPLALPYRVIALFADLALTKIHAVGERIGGGSSTGVYCGLTGVGFWDGVSGVRDLREAGAGRAPPSLPLPRPYTLALPFALVAYLRAAGDQEGEEIGYMEQQRAAVAAAVLAGAVCAAVGVFCAGAVRDCADTLYVCHLIDRAAGTRPGSGGREGEREEVWSAFDPSPADLSSAPQDAEAGLGLNFGAFNFGGFGFGGAANTAEQGGRGEEPVYARLRRTSEEANRKVPLPSVQREAAPRGFRAPSRDFSALRNYSPPPPRANVVPAPSQNLWPQPTEVPKHPPAEPSLSQRPPDPDSDADSLDSRSDGAGGGESSGAFPGSGFF
ncbi:hypothetical protein GGX14DRAFT_624438 [Mycena pura]|uniref:Transmembrane protein n=1 Tax=Mycena pura TaxID=153505 RepID=A0AAD6VGK4_9AGAR|nr:hypothetical protein GGX14DRAFT_624438 [Mycena pura]